MYYFIERMTEEDIEQVQAALLPAAVVAVGCDVPTLRPAAAPIPAGRRATVWLPDGRWWCGAPAPDAALERGRA